jgi:hypothetical protein
MTLRWPEDIPEVYRQKVEALTPAIASDAFMLDLMKIIQGIFGQHFVQHRINFARELMARDDQIIHLKAKISHQESLILHLKARRKNDV